MSETLGPSPETDMDEKVEAAKAALNDVLQGVIHLQYLVGVNPDGATKMAAARALLEIRAAIKNVFSASSGPEKIAQNYINRHQDD